MVLQLFGNQSVMLALFYHELNVEKSDNRGLRFC